MVFVVCLRFYSSVFCFFLLFTGRLCGCCQCVERRRVQILPHGAGCLKIGKFAHSSENRKKSLLAYCDRRRYSRARGLQAFPRPPLTLPFRRAFHFISHIFLRKEEKEKREKKIFIFLPVQHFRCSSRRQHSPLLRPAGPTTRAGAGGTGQQAFVAR